MTMTMAQAAKLETKNLFKKYVLENLLRVIRASELLPFITVSSFTVTGMRIRSLPDVGFRSLNGSYTVDSSGETDELWESVYILGGEVKFDRLWDKVSNYVKDPKRMITDMKIMAMGYAFNNYLINGDLATDNLGFEGLKKRVSLMPARQSVYYAGAGSAALDVTGSVANARSFFDKLREQKKYTDNGNVAFWIVNEAMQLGIGKAMTYMASAAYNWLDTTKDSYGREWPTIWGAPIYDIGTKKDQTTEIITDSETAGDAGTDATSIYAVSTNGDTGLNGIQLSEMEAVDLSEVQGSSTSKGKLFEWGVGLCNFGSYAITRGRNVEGATNWT